MPQTPSTRAVKKVSQTPPTNRKITKIASVEAFPVRNVATYCQVAHGEKQSYSLDFQADYLRNCVYRKPGWLLVGEYIERASDKDMRWRRRFSRLLEDCRARKIDLIFARSVRCFGYDVTEMLDILRELQDLGIDVYFENEELHSLGADGKLRTDELMAYVF